MDNMRSRHSTLRELQRRAHVRAQTLRAEDLDRLVGRVSILPAQTEQPGQAEGVVAVEMRHEDRFDLAWLHESGALRLHLRGFAGIEQVGGAVVA